MLIGEWMLIRTLMSGSLLNTCIWKSIMCSNKPEHFQLRIQTVLLWEVTN